MGLHGISITQGVNEDATRRGFVVSDLFSGLVGSCGSSLDGKSSGGFLKRGKEYLGRVETNSKINSLGNFKSYSKLGE